MDQGERVALSNLGALYAQATGTEQNLAKASALFQLSVGKGYGGAAFNRAVLNDRGLGVPQDPSKAAALYQMAAQSYTPAQTNLGTLYERPWS